MSPFLLPSAGTLHALQLLAAPPSGNHASSNWQWIIGLVVIIVVLVLAFLLFGRRSR